MASTATGLEASSVRKCAFCAEPILADAKKCRHCGEFVKASLSKPVLAIFATGLMIACVVAGTQPNASEGILAVGVWAIFTLLFAKMFART